MFYFILQFFTFSLFYTSQTGSAYKRKKENCNTDGKRDLNITEVVPNASQKSYICTCTCFEFCSRAIGVYNPQRQSVFTQNNLVFDSEETIRDEYNNQDGNLMFINNQWRWKTSKSESSYNYVGSYTTKSQNFRDNFSSKSTSSYNIPTENEKYIEYNRNLSQNKSIDRFKYDQFQNRVENDQDETMTMPKNSDPVMHHEKLKHSALSKNFLKIKENKISSYAGEISGCNNTIFSEDLQIEINISGKPNFQEENGSENHKTKLNVSSIHCNHYKNLNPGIISNKKISDETEQEENSRRIFKVSLEKPKIDKIYLPKKTNISLKKSVKGNKRTSINESFSKIIDDIEILYNSDLRIVVNPCDEFNFEKESLLGSYKELSDAIINIAKKYIPKFKDEDDFNYLKFESVLEIKQHDHNRLVNELSVIYKFIDESLNEKSPRVLTVFKNLKDLFNKIFMNKFNQSFLQKFSCDIYWEIFKIFIDISLDPIFSVALHEFSTFNVEKNINYFKKVNELDILNIIKFKIILRSYKYLFFKIKDNLLHEDIIDFVFNSRYYLRIYLICCFSSMWEPNFLKLYMRITCYNINIKCVETKEHMYSNSKRKSIILDDIKYFPEYLNIDHKETFIRGFFDIDFDKFILSLAENIRIAGKEGNARFRKKNYCIFTYLLSTKAKYMNRRDILLYEERRSNFMDCYLKTLNIYFQQKSELIYKVLTKNYSKKYPENKDFIYDEKKYKVFDFFLKNKIGEKYVQNLMIKLNLPQDLEKYRFWLYFEDEAIRNLVFNIKTMSFF